jgi:hypothetical protein
MLSENLIVRLSVCLSVRNIFEQTPDPAKVDLCVAFFVMNLIEH